MKPPTKILKGEDKKRAQAKYCEMLVEHDGRTTHAAEAAGLALSTVNGWKAEPAFQEMILEAQCRVDDKLRELISNKIYQDGDAQLIKLAASRRLPEYQEKKNVEVKGEVSHKHVAQLDHEARAALIAEAAQLMAPDEDVIDAEYETVD